MLVAVMFFSILLWMCEGFLLMDSHSACGNRAHATPVYPHHFALPEFLHLTSVCPPQVRFISPSQYMYSPLLAPTDQPQPFSCYFTSSPRPLHQASHITPVSTSINETLTSPSNLSAYFSHTSVATPSHFHHIFNIQLLTKKKNKPKKQTKKKQKNRRNNACVSHTAGMPFICNSHQSTLFSHSWSTPTPRHSCQPSLHPAQPS